MKDFKTIPQEIYDALPTALKNACLYFTNPQEREAFLMSALTITGSSLSNYSGTYNGQSVYPTLQLFTVYRQPIQAIHAATLLSFEIDKQLYEAYKFEKKELKEEGIKGTPNNQQRLIPAARSYSQIMNILDNKTGIGLLYNTDGKRLPLVATDEDKTLLLHNSFYNKPHVHHLLTNSRNICIDNLQLSVWLSGDYTDLQQIVPNKEHKLFPNFSYYIIEDNTNDITSPFDKNLKEVITPLFYNTFKLFRELAYETHKPFIIRDEHKVIFIKNTEGYTTQQAITYYRIVMIITMLQYFEHFKEINHNEIISTPYGLNIAHHICQVLKHHHKKVDEYLTENGIDILPEQTTVQLSEEEQLAASLYEQGMSLRNIAVELYRDESKFMRVKRILKRIGRAA